MTFNEVKEIIKEECKSNNVEFYFSKGKSVIFKSGVKSNGYFFDGEDTSPPTPKLAIATNDNSLDTIIHEYCHMRQYLEQVDVWLNLKNKSHVWEWIDGDDTITEAEVDASVSAYYEVELDCEKRAVQKHIEWDTGICLKEYIQKANAYTLFYLYMRENRVWYRVGKEPYSLEEVWTQMPNSFTFDRIECYNKVRNLFEKCI